MMPAMTRAAGIAYHARRRRLISAARRILYILMRIFRGDGQPSTSCPMAERTPPQRALYATPRMPAAGLLIFDADFATFKAQAPDAYARRASQPLRALFLRPTPPPDFSDALRAHGGLSRAIHFAPPRRRRFSASTPFPDTGAASICDTLPRCFYDGMYQTDASKCRFAGAVQHSS